jgi:hypothetical protein
MAENAWSAATSIEYVTGAADVVTALANASVTGCCLKAYVDPEDGPAASGAVKLTLGWPGEDVEQPLARHVTASSRTNGSCLVFTCSSHA